MKLGLIGTPVHQSISPELQKILFDIFNLEDSSSEEMSFFS